MVDASNSKLKGKAALVTGASRLQGIGAAICRDLAQAGADVFFTYWQAYDKAMSQSDTSKPEALQQELRGLGVKVESVEIDLGQPSAIAQLLDAAQTALGPLTI